MEYLRLPFVGPPKKEEAEEPEPEPQAPEPEDESTVWLYLYLTVNEPGGGEGGGEGSAAPAAEAAAAGEGEDGAPPPPPPPPPVSVLLSRTDPETMAAQRAEAEAARLAAEAAAAEALLEKPAEPFERARGASSHTCPPLSPDVPDRWIRALFQLRTRHLIRDRHESNITTRPAQMGISWRSLAEFVERHREWLLCWREPVREGRTLKPRDPRLALSAHGSPS